MSLQLIVNSLGSNIDSYFLSHYNENYLSHIIVKWIHENNAPINNILVITKQSIYQFNYNNNKNNGIIFDDKYLISRINFTDIESININTYDSSGLSIIIHIFSSQLLSSTASHTYNKVKRMLITGIRNDENRITENCIQFNSNSECLQYCFLLQRLLRNSWQLLFESLLIPNPMIYQRHAHIVSKYDDSVLVLSNYFLYCCSMITRPTAIKSVKFYFPLNSIDSISINHSKELPVAILHMNSTIIIDFTIKEEQYRNKQKILRLQTQQRKHTKLNKQNNNINIMDTNDINNKIILASTNMNDIDNSSDSDSDNNNNNSKSMNKSKESHSISAIIRKQSSNNINNNIIPIITDNILYDVEPSKLNELNEDNHTLLFRSSDERNRIVSVLCRLLYLNYKRQLNVKSIDTNDNNNNNNSNTNSNITDNNTEILNNSSDITSNEDSSILRPLRPTIANAHDATITSFTSTTIKPNLINNTSNYNNNNNNNNINTHTLSPNTRGVTTSNNTSSVTNRVDLSLLEAEEELKNAENF